MGSYLGSQPVWANRVGTGHERDSDDASQTRYHLLRREDWGKGHTKKGLLLMVLEKPDRVLGIEPGWPRVRQACFPLCYLLAHVLSLPSALSPALVRKFYWNIIDSPYF